MFKFASAPVCVLCVVSVASACPSVGCPNAVGVVGVQAFAPAFVQQQAFVQQAVPVQAFGFQSAVFVPAVSAVNVVNVGVRHHGFVRTRGAAFGLGRGFGGKSVTRTVTRF